MVMDESRPGTVQYREYEIGTSMPTQTTVTQTTTTSAVTAVPLSGMAPGSTRDASVITGRPEMDAHLQRGLSLLDRGRELLKNSVYRDELLNLLSETRCVVEAIANDEAMNRFSSNLKTFVADFVSRDPGTGLPSLNLDAFSRMRPVLMSLILDQLDYLPVPRIYGTTKKYDFEIGNVVLSVRDIAPDLIHIDVGKSLSLNVPQLAATAGRTAIVFTANNIVANLRDVEFWIHRKTFPRITEEGLANVTLAGTGLSLRFGLEAWLREGPNPVPVFALTFVTAHLDRFNIKVHHSKRSWLLNFMTALFAGSIRKRVETAIAQRLARVLSRSLLRINDVMSRVDVGAVTDQVKATVLNSAATVLGTKPTTST